MINFKKVLNLKIVSLTLSILFLFNTFAYSYSCYNDMLRVPSSFKDKGLSQRVEEAGKALSSNQSTRREFLADAGFVATGAVVLGTTVLMSAAKAEMALPVPASKKSDKDVKLVNILYKIGLSEDRVDVIYPEIMDVIESITGLFNKDHLQGLIEDAKDGEPERLKNFLKDLFAKLEKKGCAGQPKKIHPVLELLYMDDDISKPLGNVKDERVVSDIKAVDSSRALLVYILFKWVGIDEIEMAISPRHPYPMLKLGGTKRLIVDLGLDLPIIIAIDLSKLYSYYNAYTEDLIPGGVIDIKDLSENGGYYFLEERMNDTDEGRERLSFLHKKFSEGGLSLLINGFSQTRKHLMLLSKADRLADLSEFLNLIFPYIYPVADPAVIRHYNRAVIFWKLGNLERVITELLEAQKRDPGYSEIFGLLACVYERKGKDDEQFVVKAEELYKMAILLNRMNAEAYNDMGRLYFDRGQKEQLKGSPKRIAVAYFEKAADSYRKAIEIGGRILQGKEGGTLYSNLGSALFNSGKIEESDLAFKQAMALDPENAYANFWHAYYLYQKNDSEAAFPYFVKAVRLEKDLLENIPPLLKERVDLACKGPDTKSGKSISQQFRPRTRRSMLPFMAAL